MIVAVPGEFTTMSGRRMRNTIREVCILSCFFFLSFFLSIYVYLRCILLFVFILIIYFQIFVKAGMVDPVVVISGLSNTYSGYIATFEE